MRPEPGERELREMLHSSQGSFVYLELPEGGQRQSGLHVSFLCPWGECVPVSTWNLWPH